MRSKHTARTPHPANRRARRRGLPTARAATACTALWVLAAQAGSARADTFSLAETYRGHIRFLFVGASLTNSEGLDNGVHCLQPQGAVTVSPAQLPERARLLAAVLYAGGSLIEDDVDYIDPVERIFTPTGLRADDPADAEAVQRQARFAADASVSFQSPGMGAPVTITQDPKAPYVSVYFKPLGDEAGNIGFFVSRFDVTEAMAAAGGELAGEYRVGELRADVCRGREAVCDGAQASCQDTGFIHTNGAAAYALLLVVEDPALPPHSISVFEGLQQLFGTSVALSLEPANAISDPPSGSLAFFALEGDLTVSSPPSARSPCGFDEFIQVDGDPVGRSLPPLCLNDDDNPGGNLFNATINGQPKDGDTPCESDNEAQCCLGDGLCGVTGVDIDEFDVSPALLPGGDSVQVEVGSGGDRVALATLVLGVDVFEPILAEDSQVRVTGFDEDHVHLGDSVRYLVAVSNTGNVPAHDVQMMFEAPAHTTNLRVLATPAGAQQVLTSTGGSNGTGSITVSGFDVRPGEIRAVRLELDVSCTATGLSLQPSVTVGSEFLTAFAVTTPSGTAAGPGVGRCEGVDPNGFFAAKLEPRALRGGGGCAGSRAPPSTLGLALIAWMLATRRRVATTALLWACCLGSLVGGCTERRRTPGETTQQPPPSVNVRALPGVACPTEWMARVEMDDGASFCIDRFEAHLDDGAVGRSHQGSDDTDVDIDGSTRAKAQIAHGIAPSTLVSWYQAKAACQNAGKRLCTLAQWERACRGPEGLIYPYGDEIDDEACNGFFNPFGGNAFFTGALAACGSTYGVYDLSGNVEEWVDAPVPRTPGTEIRNDRAIRGGSFRSNFRALACVGEEFHSPPGEIDEDRGFRCCLTE